ncbi:serine-repeat antigen [Plasmodium ovale wallikeri]|uniref:Serine-repeat antigen n=1 Tax=Plasmodium ovale wallikeri TaxID=864142 RepID=A0A1A9AR93_PLAOA|nr:serine-repeat antigen [Plasmodium ovale wallikeri]
MHLETIKCMKGYDHVASSALYVANCSEKDAKEKCTVGSNPLEFLHIVDGKQFLPAEANLQYSYAKVSDDCPKPKSNWVNLWTGIKLLDYVPTPNSVGTKGYTAYESAKFKAVNTTHGSKTITSILPRWIDKFPSNVCDIVPPPLKEDFNKEKKLYDYATNFDTIDHKLRDNGYKCTREAYVYLEEYVKQYKEIKQECDKTSNTKNYCTLLKTIHETYDDNKLSNLKCKNIQIYTPEESDFPVGVSGLGGEEQAYSRDEDTAELAMQETSQFTGSHAFMAITSPIFGIILVLFTLYKFTPFGPLVSSRFLKRKIIHDNIDEENMQELLTNALNYRIIPI